MFLWDSFLNLKFNVVPNYTYEEYAVNDDRGLVGLGPIALLAILNDQMVVENIQKTDEAHIVSSMYRLMRIENSTFKLRFSRSFRTHSFFRVYFWHTKPKFKTFQLELLPFWNAAAGLLAKIGAQLLKYWV